MVFEESWACMNVVKDLIASKSTGLSGVEIRDGVSLTVSLSGGLKDTKTSERKDERCLWEGKHRLGQHNRFQGPFHENATDT